MVNCVTEFGPGEQFNFVKRMARAALDKDGAVLGYAFENKVFSRVDTDTNETDPVYSLAGQLIPAK